jgi:hypothetical protein
MRESPTYGPMRGPGGTPRLSPEADRPQRQLFTRRGVVPGGGGSPLADGGAMVVQERRNCLPAVRGLPQVLWSITVCSPSASG